MRADYAAIHARMGRERGKASQHQCVGCPAPARDWAQVHTEDGSDIWTDYLPLCCRCHMRYDGTDCRRLNVARWAALSPEAKRVEIARLRLIAANGKGSRRCPPGCTCQRHRRRTVA